jgi:hypothetical protein
MPISNQVGEVLARVEGAERGSYALNADIYELLGYEVKRQSETVQRGWRTVRTIAWRYFDGRSWLAMSDLSGDTDDALALANRLLPDCAATLTRYRTGKGACQFWRTSPTNPKVRDWVSDSDEQDATLPLAILAALLHALANQETDRGNG